MFQLFRRRINLEEDSLPFLFRSSFAVHCVSAVVDMFFEGACLVFSYLASFSFAIRALISVAHCREDLCCSKSQQREHTAVTAGANLLQCNVNSEQT